MRLTHVGRQAAKPDVATMLISTSHWIVNPVCILHIVWLFKRTALKLMITGPRSPANNISLQANLKSGLEWAACFPLHPLLHWT